MKKIIVLLAILLIWSTFLSSFLYFQNEKNISEKNEIENTIKNYKKQIEEKEKIISQKNKELNEKIYTQEEIKNKENPLFWWILTYKLTQRDLCVLPLFMHPALSYYWNREESFYDLLKFDDWYKFSCDWLENEKSILEFILIEPIENTRWKLWEGLFDEPDIVGWINWKDIILIGSLDFLKKNKNLFSQKNLEDLKDVFKRTRNFVEKESPKTKKAYDGIYEFFDIKN